jgi:hypothetical protein
LPSLAFKPLLVKTLSFSVDLLGSCTSWCSGVHLQQGITGGSERALIMHGVKGIEDFPSGQRAHPWLRWDIVVIDEYTGKAQRQSVGRKSVFMVVSRGREPNSTVSCS